MSNSPALSPNASLSTSEGALVSVSIHADPRDLESLLEALARIEFPINPQIYHDAEVVTVHPDGREEIEAAAVVEFPAYLGRLDEVHRALEAYGFGRDAVHVTSMLDELRAKDPFSLGRAQPTTERVMRYARKAAALRAG